jgi:hypothetical protein
MSFAKVLTATTVLCLAGAISLKQLADPPPPARPMLVHLAELRFELPDRPSPSVCEPPTAVDRSR